MSTTQDTINAASGNDPARRSQLLAEAHPWLDPDVQVTLANSDSSDQSILAQAQAFGAALTSSAQAAGSAVTQVSHFFEDPVLHKQPSAGLKLQQYLLQRQGFLPVAQADLAHIQQSLVDKGYLDAGSVTGVWTPESQQAFAQAASDHYESLHQSNEGGGFDFGHAIHGFFSSLAPSHAVPALIGAVKALPGEFRDVASNLTGGVVTLGTLVGTLDPKKALRTGADVSLNMEQLFGAHKGETLDQYGSHSIFGGDTRALFEQEANVLNTFLAVYGGGVVAHGVKNAAGEAVAKGMFTDLGKEAAMRGPGVISRSMYDVGVNGEKTGLLNSRMFTNTPILKQMVPPVRAVFNPDGTFSHAYYAMRSAAATPYRYPAVQLAGNIGQKTLIAGAATRGVAAGERAAGMDTPLGDQVYAQATIGGPFGLALDLLSAGLHGPLETRFTRAAANDGRRVLIGVNPSKHVSDIAATANAGMDAAFRPLGVAWSFEAGTGIKFEDLVAEVGEENAHWFLNAKLNEFAAAEHAHAQLEGQGLTGHDWAEAFKAASHEAYHNADVLRGARDDMLGNLAALTAAFRRDSNRIIGDHRKDYSNGIKSLLSAWTDAHELYANHAAELITPLTKTAIKDARAEYEFSKAMGDEVGLEPGGYNGWLKTGNPEAERGSLGIATLDAETSQSAKRYASGLQERWNRVKPGEQDTTDALRADRRAVRKDALTYLAVELGVRETELERFDTEGLIQLIRDKSSMLASEIHLPLDPSPRVNELIRSLEEKGYRPVFGTDIGHAFTPPIIEPSVIEGAATFRRKAISALGLNNLKVSTKVAGSLRREAVIREWQLAINDGKLRVPPGWNASRMYEFLHGQLESKAELGKVAGAFFRASGAAFKAQLEHKAAVLEAEGLTRGEAIARARQEIEAHIARGTQPLEVTGSEFRRALMQSPGMIANELRDLAHDTPLMDEKSAALAHHLYLKALSKEPLWAFGLGKIEDMFRAGFGFLGQRTANVPVVKRLAVMPNELVRFRNKYRFTVDPIFSARRISKTALKMALADVRWTIRPFESMVKQGTLNDDLKTLNRIYPMKGHDGFDNMDRALHEQDVFGWYNPRHFMAFAAGEWKRQGLSDTEIKARLERTFTYGDRTALERTISTFFYPFSFERTLYRNLGGYMLDHPGQRMALAAAVQAYDALSKHHDIGKWLEEHGPILKEFKKLNAFEHGIGPGQLGGINAPYAPALWNVFGPQKWGAMKEPELNLVLQALPVLRDLNSLLVGENVYTGERQGGSLVQQAEVGYWGMRNAADDVTRWATGNERSPWNPQHPSISPQAQQEKAWEMRNAMILKLAPVLDYNYHHRDNPLRWTDSEDLPPAIRGQSISRTSISEIVHRFYPAYDPNAAQGFAIEKQREEKVALADIRVTDPARAAYFTEFSTAAHKLVPIMQRAMDDPVNTPALAGATAGFRQAAVNLAEQDPMFLAYYERYWQSTFGPIRELSL